MAQSRKRLASKALGALRSSRRLKTIPSQGGMTEALLISLISRGASVAGARKALDRIKSSVVNWNELRVTQISDVTSWLGSIRDAAQKAAAIHEVLSSIFEQTHDLEFVFLDGANAAEARDFLRGLGALNDEIVDEVMLAGRGRFAMPADGDILRFSRRLGLVGRTESIAECQEVLEDVLGAERAYQFMYLGRELAETVCVAHSPHCKDCALSLMCASARLPRSR